MRFVCDSCRAQYQISDEKVGAKGVKVRCKKCGFVILVKRPEISAAAPKAPHKDVEEGQATQLMENPLGGPSNTMPGMPSPDVTSPGVPGPAHEARPGKSGKQTFAGMGEDEIGAVFDQVLNTGANKVPGDGTGAPKGARSNGEEDDRMSTRVLDADVVRKLAAEAGARDKAAEAKGKAEPANDWFVAIDEKQTGPLTVEKLKDHWNRGEVGPDSLCWRAGFGDWLPLSEVAELAAVLAPRPAKPVIVAPAQVAPVMTVPVESAFSAGGVVKTVRSEMSVPMAASPSEDASGWKPSAASALASLAKADIEALTKPKSKGAPPAEAVATLDDDRPKPATPGRLLDLPTGEMPANGKSNGASQYARERPVVQEEAHAPAHRPRPAPMPMYPTQGGATFTSPGYSSYRPPSRKGLFIALGLGGGVVVLGSFVIAIFFATRQPVMYPQPNFNPSNYQQQVPQQPGQQMAPPGSAVAPQAAPPAPVAPVAPAPVAAAPTAATEAPTAAAPTAAVAPQAPTAPAAAPVSNRRTAKRHETSAPAGKGAEVAPEPPPKPSAPEPSGDDFDIEFGGGSSRADVPKSETKAKQSHSVYVPPAPGASAADIPDQLGQADIITVVLTNKPALARCVDEQRKKDPGIKGRLSVRWTMQPNGKTSNVQVLTEEFKTTYMATCVSQLIKGWTFPKHKSPQDVDGFPFNF